MSDSVSREALVSYLDEYLELSEWDDKSLNGLQVEGAPEVRRIALATDAATATFEMAATAEAQLLVTHHGLFWGPPEPVVGPFKQRLAILLKNDLSLYVAHLPLDGHSVVGNNVVLGTLLGLEGIVPFGKYGDRSIGVRGRLPQALERTRLLAQLEALLGARTEMLPFGSEAVRTVGIVSGAACDLIPEAASTGVDAFITGETSHIAWHTARELRINVFFAGHYATETLGVQALGDHLTERFGLECVFLDVPTGY